MVSFIVLWLSAAQIFILFFWCVYYTHLTLGIKITKFKQFLMSARKKS